MALDTVQKRRMALWTAAPFPPTVYPTGDGGQIWRQNTIWGPSHIVREPHAPADIEDTLTARGLSRTLYAVAEAAARVLAATGENRTMTVIAEAATRILTVVPEGRIDHMVALTAERGTDKYAGETKTYGIDFSPELASGVAIAIGYTLTSSPAGLTLTELDHSNSDQQINFTVAGGTAGTTYTLVALVVSDASPAETLEARFKIKVRPAAPQI